MKLYQPNISKICLSFFLTSLILMILGCSGAQQSPLSKKAKAVIADNLGPNFETTLSPDNQFALCIKQQDKPIEPRYLVTEFSVYDLANDSLVFTKKMPQTLVSWHDADQLLIKRTLGTVQVDDQLKEKSSSYLLNVRTNKKSSLSRKAEF